jgi:uncharacterized protein
VGSSEKIAGGDGASGTQIVTTWRLETLRQRRQEILATAQRRGARNVQVFGSVARDEATPASDVDFLVDFEEGRSLLDHGGLAADLEELLGCHVDVVSRRALRPRFRDRVLAEAVRL